MVAIAVPARVYRDRSNSQRYVVVVVDAPVYHTAGFSFQMNEDTDYGSSRSLILEKGSLVGEESMSLLSPSGNGPTVLFTLVSANSS